MNPLMRRLGAAALALLLLLPCPLAVAQEPLLKFRKFNTTYGLESERRMPSDVMRQAINTLPRATRAGNIPTSPYSFEQPGGVWSFGEGRLRTSTRPLPRVTVSLPESLKAAANKDLTNYHLINSGESVLNSLGADQRKHYADLVARYNGENYDWRDLEARALSSAGINRAALNELSNSDRRLLLLYAESLGASRASSFNGDDVPQSFYAQASALKLVGSPQLQLIAQKYTANHALTASSPFTAGNISRLRLVNQECDDLIKVSSLDDLLKYAGKRSLYLLKQLLR